MAKRPRKSPAAAAASLVAAQARVAEQAGVLADRAQRVQAAIDPEGPFAPALAGAAAALFAAADDLCDQVRRQVVLDLTGTFPHSTIAEIVGMSVWWVGKVVRDDAEARRQ
ncbi:hypothetical protein KV112_20615 [Mycolicibacter sp. MYC123]|uniref:RNA polymerase subunit sigma-70 n=1 Tax=[Mycobacterium] zoologicum TaxID=2872311 RepID=A0ABU5YTS2_9MYCO|nr:hypothetical protein [Mycolicibacter sp. MYC123]MEB3052118.1 hypothetical protein [Mycolicibacter sp. MYC123]